MSLDSGKSTSRLGITHSAGGPGRSYPACRLATHSMEARLTRNFDRALRNLTQLRKKAFWKTNPGSIIPRLTNHSQNHGIANRKSGRNRPILRPEAPPVGSIPQRPASRRARSKRSPKGGFLKTVLRLPHLTSGHPPCVWI
jgi:hypothetical protein